MRWGVSILRAPGRLAALGVVAIALTLRVIDFGIVEEPRLRIFDFVEWLWSPPTVLSPVVVVEIDEASLARYGQRPWPRGKVADLVRRIGQERPLFWESTSCLPNQIVFHRGDRARTNRASSGAGGAIGRVAGERP
jgi:adenylate cyclase